MDIETSQTLLKQWKLNQLQVERAMGQVLQHLVRLDKDNEAAKKSRTTLAQTLREQTAALKKLRDDLDALMAHTGLAATNEQPRPRRRATK